MWHVSSRSGVATLRTAIHLLLTYQRSNGEVENCKINPNPHAAYTSINVDSMLCRCQAEAPAGIVKCPLCKFRTVLGPTSIQGLPVNTTAIQQSARMSGVRSHYRRQLHQIQPRSRTAAPGKGPCGINALPPFYWIHLTFHTPQWHKKQVATVMVATVSITATWRPALGCVEKTGRVHCAMSNGCRVYVHLKCSFHAVGVSGSWVRGSLANASLSPNGILIG